MASSQLMIQVMGKIPLFKGFSPTQLRHILGICEHRTLEADTMLCQEGVAADEFYIREPVGLDQLQTLVEMTLQK
jgi:arginine/ornithine N-succinyltransferase beta subunit